MSLRTSAFPPIADYAFLSNCHTGALVAADGSVDWLCVPAFDSPRAFGNLLAHLLLDWEADEFRQFVADVEPAEEGSQLSSYEGAHVLAHRLIEWSG